MSQDTPSCACIIIEGADQTWGTNRGTLHFFRRWESGRETTCVSVAMLSIYFTPKCLRPFYDPTKDEEANDRGFVLATARDPCRVDQIDFLLSGLQYLERRAP